jgi:hypothetical protein
MTDVEWFYRLHGHPLKYAIVRGCYSLEMLPYYCALDLKNIIKDITEVKNEHG